MKFIKAQTPWNKGVPFSEEIRNKMSASKRAYYDRLKSDGVAYSHGGLFKKGVPSKRYLGGEVQTPEYKAYHRAKSRSTNPNVWSWKYYGGRGILFLFESYQEFLDDIGRRPGPEYSLDRIDTNGHYEVGNVKWSTTSEQMTNRRYTSAIRLSDGRMASTVCKERGIPRSTFHNRIKRGLTPDEAVGE